MTYCPWLGPAESLIHAHTHIYRQFTHMQTWAQAHVLDGSSEWDLNAVGCEDG